MSESRDLRRRKNIEFMKSRQTSTNWFSRNWQALVALAVFVILVPSLYFSYIYVSSPEVIRKPTFEHYHFRVQVIVDGQAVNFADTKYQQGYSKDQCTTALADTPFHFHDDKDQFAHVHWAGMTGGLWMKDYGWNFIGGSDSALGYRFDLSGLPKEVPIRGQLLPDVPNDANFYIYVGDSQNYTEKSFNDWKNESIETFLGKQSSVPKNPQSSSLFQNLLFPRAYAHNVEDEGVVVQEGESNDAKLERINNLIGNVVLFVQHDRPTDQQVHERFENLVPLSASTCSG